MSDETHGLYAALAAHFEDHGKKPGTGSTELIFVTGEQVIARLNDVLGPEGWEFEVQQSDLLQGPPVEAVVRGRLTVHFPTRTVVREQWGSQQVQGRGELGNLYKGATTDALKKCASLVGVGLYLFDAEERDVVRHEMAQERRNDHAPRPAAPAQAAPRPATTAAPEAPVAAGEPPYVTAFYARCEAELLLDRPAVLARLGTDKLGTALKERGWAINEAGIARLFDVVKQVPAATVA